MNVNPAIVDGEERMCDEGSYYLFVRWSHSNINYHVDHIDTRAIFNGSSSTTMDFVVAVCPHACHPWNIKGEIFVVMALETGGSHSQAWRKTTQYVICVFQVIVCNSSVANICSSKTLRVAWEKKHSRVRPSTRKTMETVSFPHLLGLFPGSNISPRLHRHLIVFYSFGI